MNVLKIEKGIPIPKSVLGKRRIYPFDEMKVGESFYSEKSISSSSFVASKRTGFKFTQRSEGKGFRIWRVK